MGGGGGTFPVAYRVRNASGRVIRGEVKHSAFNGWIDGSYALEDGKYFATCQEDNAIFDTSEDAENWILDIRGYRIRERWLRYNNHGIDGRDIRIVDIPECPPGATVEFTSDGFVGIRPDGAQGLFGDEVAALVWLNAGHLRDNRLERLMARKGNRFVVERSRPLKAVPNPGDLWTLVEDR